MAYTIEPHPELPVFVATFSGRISAEEFDQWNRELFAMTHQLPLKVGYVLVDVREAQAEFGELLQGIARVSQAASQATIESVFFLLGNHPMVQLSVELLKQPQYGGFEVPIFLKHEDALAAVRADMALRQASGNQEQT